MDFKFRQLKDTPCCPGKINLGQPARFYMDLSKYLDFSKLLDGFVNIDILVVTQICQN